VTRRPGDRPPLEEALLGRDLDAEAEAERVAAEKAELRRVFLVNLMGNEMFREWLMGWITELGAFDNIHAAGPTGFPDPMATQFYLGRRSAGWDLWTFFDDLSPELASLMRREARGKG
jgi:hypothetical protein